MLLVEWIKKVISFFVNNTRYDNFGDIDELLNSQPFIVAPDDFTSKVMAGISTASDTHSPYRYGDKTWGASLIAAGCLILMLTLTPIGHRAMNAAANNTKPFALVTKSLETVYSEFNKITHWISKPIQNIRNIDLGGEHFEL